MTRPPSAASTTIDQLLWWSVLRNCYDWFNTVLPDRLNTTEHQASSCLMDQRLLLQLCTENQSGSSSLHSLHLEHQLSTRLHAEFLTVYIQLSYHPDNIIIKSTPLVGLIPGGDETAFQSLVGQCADNNLVLNTSKTKELIVDLRRRRSNLQPVCINVEWVETVSSFRFLKLHINADLQWNSETSGIMKKSQLYDDPQEDQPEEGTVDRILSLLHWEIIDIFHLCLVLKLH